MTTIIRTAICVIMAIVPLWSAQAEWWEARTDHFVVYSESSQSDARKFAIQLDRFDGALRTLQGMPTEGDVGPASKVTIYRTGEPSDIGKLAGGGSVYGFYMARAGGSVAFVPAKNDLQRGMRHYESQLGRLNRSVVLNHEYTHHFMLKNFPATYPGWYIEGYAELMAMIELRDDGSFHVGNAPEHRAYELFQMQMVPLEQLLDNTHRLRGNQWINQYGQGWLLTHYLFFSKEREGQLAAYLKAIRSGEMSLPVAQRIFGDLKQLESELRGYLTKQRPGAVVQPASSVAPRVEMRRLSKEEESLMRSRILLSRGVTHKDARGILADLKALGEWSNSSIQAQLQIAEAALDCSQFADALAAADRAIALDSNSSAGLMFKARALSEAKESDGLAVKNRFAAARALLVQARKLDERDPQPLILYYKTFVNSGEPLTEQARLALESAFPQAAHDSSYRLLLAQQLLAEDRMSDARTVLMPIAFGAHAGDPEKNPLTKVVQALEANDLAAAKSAMAELVRKQKEEEEKNKG